MVKDPRHILLFNIPEIGTFICVFVHVLEYYHPEKDLSAGTMLVDPMASNQERKKKARTSKKALSW